MFATRKPSKVAGRIRWNRRLPIDARRDEEGRLVIVYEVPFAGKASPERMARAVEHHLKLERFGSSYNVRVEVTKVYPDTDTMLVKTTETLHD